MSLWGQGVLGEEERMERDAGQQGRLGDDMGTVCEDDGVFTRGVCRWQAVVHRR